MPLPSSLATRMRHFLDHRWREGLGLARLVAGPHVQYLSDPTSIQVCGNDYLQVEGLEAIRQIQARALAGADPRSQLFRSAAFDVERKHGPEPPDGAEAHLARYLGKEAACLGQSGFAINEGIAAALGDRALPAYIDHAAHASFWPGLRFGTWKSINRFPHNDVAGLRRLMDRHGPGVVFLESLYSTDGSIAPLAQLADLAEHSVLVIDEAHSLGLYGPRGAGMCVQLGLNRLDNVIVTGSLSKAFATRAGFLAGSRDLVAFFVQKSFPAIFSSSLLEHEQARIQALLAWMTSDEAEQRRARLRAICRALRGAALAMRDDLLLPLGEPDPGPCRAGSDEALDWSPVLSLRCHSEEDVASLRDHLESGGQGALAGPETRRVFGSVFVHPATPRRYPTYRLSLHCGLGAAELAVIQGLLAGCAGLRKAPLRPLPPPVPKGTLTPRDLAAPNARTALWYRLQGPLLAALAVLVVSLAGLLLVRPGG